MLQAEPLARRRDRFEGTNGTESTQFVPQTPFSTTWVKTMLSQQSSQWTKVTLEYKIVRLLNP